MIESEAAQAPIAPLRRVILHIDLDCFYAQVESIRLGIPQTEPLAVQQWGSLLAVNYAARQFNVKRGDNITQAKEKCPSIHLPHVETVGKQTALSSAAESTRPDRRFEKAILKRYRDASAAIFSIFAQHCDVMQKASIDEVFMDVSSRVEERLAAAQSPAGWQHDSQTMVFGHHHQDEEEDEKVVPHLQMGARIASEIRAQVLHDLGYTCSAGISHNKLLAKMASPLNKPNGQVIVPQEAVDQLMLVTDVRSMNGFGGKLGQRILQLGGGVETAKDVQRFSIQELRNRLGGNVAEYVFWRCRGVDSDPVVEQSLPKSIMSAKLFREKCPLSALKHWVRVLTTEVVERVGQDKETNQRVASKLGITFSSASDSKSKTIPLTDLEDLEALIESIYTLVRAHATMFPLTQLAVVARDFQPLGIVKPITTFFSKRPAAEECPEEAAVHPPAAAEDASMITCRRCWQRIEKESVQEHEDFHFALELQKQQRVVVPVQKKAKKNSRPSIASYFTKQSE